jgi:hypothetical protein
MMKINKQQVLKEARLQIQRKMIKKLQLKLLLQKEVKEIQLMHN